MATSLHVARRHSTLQPTDPPLFSPESPEADWLRRKSSYLLPSRKAWFRGLYSVAFGLSVNLVMVGAAIWLGAAYVAWFLRATNRTPEGLSSPHATQVEYWQSETSVEGLVAWAAAGCLIAAGIYLLLAKVVSKYTRGQVAALGPTTVFLSLAASIIVFLAFAPALLVTLHNSATSNEPGRMVAQAIKAVGLVSDTACDKAVRRDFARQARLTWLEANEPTTADDLPFTYGACGEQYEDNAAIFPAVANAGDPLADDVCPGPADLPSDYPDRPVPAYCAPERDSTGGWPSRIAAALALLATLTAIVRGMTAQGERQESSRLRGFVAYVRQAAMPWAALTIVTVTLVIVALRALRHFFTQPAALDSWNIAATFGSFLLLRLLSDATTSSLHPFYRERISETFFVRRKDGAVSALDFDYGTDVAPEDKGRDADPGLVVLCVANVQDVDYVPAQRGCVTFRFETGTQQSPAFIGISDRRLPMITDTVMTASTYSRHADPAGKDTTLSAAVAASGAAFSPVVGRMSRRVKPYRIVLTLANARLGVWLPNPYWTLALTPPPTEPGFWRVVTRRLTKPGAFRIVKEAFGQQSIYDEHLYVTDGGHFDNTGMVEALRDRPRQLVVLDASADAAGSLDALADAITTARMDLNLLIEPADGDYRPLVAPPPSEDNPEPRPQRAWLHLVATELSPAAGRPAYTCDIYFVKNVLSEGPDLELDSYRRENPEFPITTTVNQFYGEYDFEAYRQLGWRNTEMMLDG